MSDKTSSFRFLTMHDVIALTGSSRSGIYDLESRGLFPKRIRMPGGKSVRFRSDEVQEWMEKAAEAGRINSDITDKAA